MKHFLIALLVSAFALLPFGKPPEAKADVFDVVGKVVAAPGKLAGEVAKRTLRGAAKGVAGAAKGVARGVLGRRSPRRVGHPRRIAVWQVYYYPYGPHYRPLIAGTFYNYRAAQYCCVQLSRRGYVARVIRIR